jgi:hypothetical protein
MFERGFAPPSASIPVAAVRKTCQEWERAEAELRADERELQQLLADDGKARIADVQATAEALAAGEPDPGPQHQIEHRAFIEQVERRRDARRILAAQRWGALVEAWAKHRGELVAAVEKQRAKADARWAAAIGEVESARWELAETVALQGVCADGEVRWRGPERYLARVQCPPLLDGPGVGALSVSDLIGALARLGQPEPEAAVIMDAGSGSLVGESAG